MTSTPCAFTTDIEDYFQAEALREFCPRDQWDQLEDRTERNTERLLEVCERHRITGTFFVLGWTAERHANLVRRIAAQGHEVASHGYSHELIYRQSPDAFREDVRKAKALLEDMVQKPVLGYRAPSYTIVTRTLWALDILEEEGYAYDSSVFPIKRRKYGIPGAPRVPYRHQLGEGRTLPEFPLPALNLGPLRVPVTGGAYLRLLPFGFQAWGFRRLLSQGVPVVLNVHPWELDSGQPRFPVAPRTRWTHYTNLDKTQVRLEQLLRMAEFKPLQEWL